MKVETNIAAWRQLAAVEQDAARLTTIAVPKAVFRDERPNAAAAQTLGHAIEGMDSLSQSLAEAGAPTQAVDDARAAYRMLASTPLHEAELRAAGTQLTATLKNIRTRSDDGLKRGMVEHMQMFADSPITDFRNKLDQHKDLLQLAAVPEVQDAFPRLRSLDPAALAELNDTRTFQDHKRIEAMAGTVRALLVADADVADRVTDAVRTFRGMPWPIDAGYLKTLAERDPSIMAQFPEVASELAGVTAHTMTPDTSSSLARALGRAHAALMSPDELAEAVRAATSKSYENFLISDALNMREAVRRGTPGVTDRWQQLFPDMEPIGTVLDTVSETGSRANIGIYLGRIAVDAMTPAERTAFAHKLSGQIQTGYDWTNFHGLAAMLRTPERSIMHVPETIPGQLSFDEVIIRAANGDQTVRPLLDRYGHLMGRGKDMSTSHQLDVVDRLAASTDTAPSSSDWADIYALASGTFADVPLPAAWTPDVVHEVRSSAISGMMRGEFKQQETTAHTSVTARALDQLKLDNLTSDDLDARLRQTVLLLEQASTPSDWARIETLMRRASTTNPLPIPTDLPGHAPLADVVHQLATEPDLHPDALTTVHAYLDAYLRTTEPELGMRISDALYAAAHGSLTDDARELLATRPRLATVVSTGLPSYDRLSVDATMYGQSADLAKRTGVRSYLDAIGPTVADMRVQDAGVEALRSETLQLIERNARRIDGLATPGTVQGFLQHPDYAEVGDIRSGVEMLAMSERQTAKALAARRTAARRAAQSPTPVPSDVIDW